MALTFATTKALAQTLLDDTSTASGITSTQWVTLFNAANRDVWRDLAAMNPSYFQTYGDITWPANTERLVLSGASYLNTTPYKIVQVEASALGGNPTTQNGIRKLRMMTFQERPQILSDYMTSLATGQAPGPYAYSYEDDATMYLAPISGSSVLLRIYYIPPLAAVTGVDADVVLGGRAPDFHDAVAHRLAWYGSVKRGGTPGVAAQLWAESSERIRNSAPTRTEDDPWSVRRVC